MTEKTYLDLDMMPDVEVRLSTAEPRTVIIAQEGENEQDMVAIRRSQVPAVIKALRAFLKDVP